MRGKVVNSILGELEERITPACAGKRVYNGCTAEILFNHPRVCGEKSTSCFQVIRDTGSPPRVRGKVTSLGIIGAPFRITPAYAGKRRKMRDFFTSM